MCSKLNHKQKKDKQKLNDLKTRKVSSKDAVIQNFFFN